MECSPRANVCSSHRTGGLACERRQNSRYHLSLRLASTELGQWLYLAIHLVRQRALGSPYGVSREGHSWVLTHTTLQLPFALSRASKDSLCHPSIPSRKNRISVPRGRSHPLGLNRIDHTPHGNTRRELLPEMPSRGEKGHEKSREQGSSASTQGDAHSGRGGQECTWQEPW